MAFDGTLKFDTKIDSTGFKSGVSKLGSLASAGVKTILASVAAVSTAMVGAATAAVKVGSDFEASMSQVSAISGATGKDLDDLTAKAKEMGAKTKFSASESADAFQYMAMAGWQTADMLDGIEGIMNLAAASGEDLASVSDIVTDALTAFGLQAKDSAHFSDVLAKASSNSNTNVGLMGATFKYVAPIAGAMKYSIEDTATAIGLMANAGIKGEQAGTSLRAMLTRLVKPTDEVAGAMDALGINMTNTDGAMKPLREVIGDLRESFSKLSDSEKAEYAANIAGQEAMSGLLAIVNASDDDFESLTAAIDSAEGAASDMATTMQDNLQGRVEELKGGVETLGLEIYESIQEPLKKAVETGIDYIGRLSDAFTDGGLSGAVEEAGNIFADLATKAAQGAPKMIDAAVKFIQSFLQGIQKNSSKLLAAAQSIVKALVDGLVKLLPKSVQKPVNDVIQAVTKSFNSSALKNAIKTVGTIITNLAKVISNIAKVVIPIFNSALGFLGDNLEWIFPLFVSVVTAIKTMQLLQQAAAWWTAMSKAVEVATGSLTICQTIVGVLTGQIELATIAQGLWNAVMAANPIGLVATAVGLLVGALGLLIANLPKARDEGWKEVEAAQAEADAHKEARIAIQEQAAEYMDLAKRQAEHADASVEELKYVEDLAGELMNLADETGRVKDADKGRAEFILGKLNNALGTEYKMTGSIIDNYQDLTKSIYDQIKAKEAKIYLDSMEEEFTVALQKKKEALNKQIELGIDLSKKKQDAVQTEMDLAEAQGELEDILNDQMGQYDLIDEQRAVERVERLTSSRNAELKSIEELEYARKENEQLYKQYYKNISDYETASRLISEGNTEEAIRLLEDRNLALLDAEALAGKSKDEQIRILKEQSEATAEYAKKLKQDYLNGVSGVTAQMVKDAEDIADTALEEFKSIGGSVDEGIATGAEDNAYRVNNAMEDVVGAAEDGLDGGPTWPGMKTAGWNAGKALMDGAASATKSPAAQNVWSSYYTAGKNAASWFAKGAGCASPSKLTRKTGVHVIQGAELGLQDEAPKLLRQTDMLGESLSDSLQISPPDTAALVAKMRAAVAASSGLVSSGISAQTNYKVSVGAKQQEASSPADRNVPQTIQNRISIDGREFAIVTTPYIEEEMAYR